MKSVIRDEKTDEHFNSPERIADASGTSLAVEIALMLVSICRKANLPKATVLGACFDLLAVETLRYSELAALPSEEAATQFADALLAKMRLTAKALARNSAND